MALNLNDYDSIAIPEGNVKIIRDPNNALWYKQQYQTIDLIPLCKEGYGYWNTSWTSISGYNSDVNWIYSTWIPVQEGKIVYKAYMFSMIGHFTAWDENGVELGYRAGTGSGVMNTGEWELPTGTKYIRVCILNPDSPTGQRYNQSIQLICKNPLPRQYERLDSIASTRVNRTGQYIDTGIYPKANHIIHLTLTSLAPTTDECFFGMASVSGSFLGNLHSHWRIGSNIKESNIDSTSNKTLARAQGDTWDINGETDTCSAIAANATQTYYLFACYQRSYGVLYGSVRIHQLIIMTQKSASWQFVGNVPEAFFIPCRDLDTNTLGMFDYVSKTFKTNLGTGNFTV